MSKSNIIDLIVVGLALIGCGFWIWWDERDRRRRREHSERQLQELRRLDALAEQASRASALNQESDSGGNHSS